MESDDSENPPHIKNALTPLPSHPDAEPDIALRDEFAPAPQGPLMAAETAGQYVATDDEEYLRGASMEFEQVEHATDQRGRPLTQARIEREVVPTMMSAATARRATMNCERGGFTVACR